VSRCLDTEGLLAQSVAEPMHQGDGHEHLMACPACSAAYGEILGQNALIVRMLQSTAEAIMIAPPAEARARLAPILDARRTNRPRAISFSGIAAGFAGAMAAALLLILCIVPPSARIFESTFRIARADVRNSTGKTARAPDRITSNSAFPDIPWQSDQDELILTEPTDQIGYQEAIAGRPSYQDLFFCDPYGDEAFCPSPERG
jgi:hypothetical protein